MNETLLNVALAVAILGGSALVTHFFARAMYITCPKCRTLNTRRRVACRKCGGELRTSAHAEGPRS
jgi:hypothetical protein